MLVVICKIKITHCLVAKQTLVKNVKYQKQVLNIHVAKSNIHNNQQIPNIDVSSAILT